MFWLVGGNVYDVEAGAFRRADIAIRDQRIDGIVACRANPLDDIEELTPIAVVMQGGVVYRNQLRPA
ncbi:MAG: hypothetical protein ACREEE_04040 [Dongiaceae bacterium]